MVLKFETRKQANRYAKFIRDKGKSFGLTCKPKVIERKKDYHFVVLERCQTKK